MKPDFKWKATFALLNAKVEKPFSIDGMEFDTHPKSNKDAPKLFVTYRFKTSSGSTPSNVADEARETMDRFLACADANLAIIGWDARHAVEDFDIELENREEIRNSGIQPPTKVSIQIRNTSTFKRDEFVLPSWESASKLSTHHDADLIFRILRLLRHSILEDDEYDRFSKIWRGFNAFYNSRSTQPSEASRIREFAQKLSPSLAYPRGWLTMVLNQYCTALPKPTPISDYLTLALTRRNWTSVTDCLIKQNLTDRNKVNHSQNLAKAVATRNLQSVLESALLCLYVERNKVMHGEIISDDDRDLLYVCASFLQRIVAIALNEFYFIPLKAQQP